MLAEAKPPTLTLNKENIMAKIIYVKSTLPANKDKSFPLAVREKSDEHPEGEVYISGTKVFEVAETPTIIAALKTGGIVEVKKSEFDAQNAVVEVQPAEVVTEKKATQTAKATTQDKTATAEVKNDLPEDLPHREILIKENNITSYQKLCNLKGDEVLALKNIGEERRAEISEYIQAHPFATTPPQK